MDSNDIIAPFILKTYHMVNDPSLDGYIRWGPANNTFIVFDPLDFSQRLLPANFKHNNFSSFVRQLNTYGFKKVDPDRWEFANEWFLRGQTHLLKNIGRKKLTGNSNSNNNNSRNNSFVFRGEEEEDESDMVVEIAKLKEEQKALEQELVGMNKRLEATERRPDQMMALLHKVADDPQILPRMMYENNQRFLDKKRQRRLISPPPSLPAPSAARPRTTADNGGEGDYVEPDSLNGIIGYVNNTDEMGGGYDMGYSGGFWSEPEVRRLPEYPFSLFGGGF